MEIERLAFAPDDYPESLFRLYAADRRSWFLVATTGTGPSAHVQGYVIARLDRWGAEVVSIAVDPNLRKRGIGRMLLTAILKRVRRHDAQSIRLMVRSNNPGAAKFYRSHGFLPVGLVRNYYEDGGTAIRMRLKLDPSA
jgi:ribosomal-protein-alanine N-acetyltransferase